MAKITTHDRVATKSLTPLALSLADHHHGSGATAGLGLFQLENDTKDTGLGQVQPPLCGQIHHRARDHSLSLRDRDGTLDHDLSRTQVRRCDILSFGCLKQEQFCLADEYWLSETGNLLHNPLSLIDQKSPLFMVLLPLKCLVGLEKSQSF